MRYFQDLERLFNKFQVIDNKDKKKAAVTYPSAEVEATWTGLAVYEDAAKLYAEFKQEILLYYPGTDPQKKWSVTDLRALVVEHISKSG